MLSDDASSSLRLRLARAAVDVMLSDFQCRRDAARSLLGAWLNFADERRRRRQRALPRRHTADAAARTLALRRAAVRWRSVGRWASVGRAVARLERAARADAARTALHALWTAARDAFALHAAFISHAHRLTSNAIAAWGARAATSPRREHALARAQHSLLSVPRLRRMRNAFDALATASRASLLLIFTSATATAHLIRRRRRARLNTAWRLLSACRDRAHGRDALRRAQFLTITRRYLLKWGADRDRTHKLAALRRAHYSTVARCFLLSWSAAARWRAKRSSMAWLGHAASCSNSARLAFVRWRCRANLRFTFARATAAMDAVNSQTARRLFIRRLRVYTTGMKRLAAIAALHRQTALRRVMGRLQVDAGEGERLQTAGLRGRIRTLERGMVLWRVRTCRSGALPQALQAAGWKANDTGGGDAAPECVRASCVGVGGALSLPAGRRHTVGGPELPSFSVYHHLGMRLLAPSSYRLLGTKLNLRRALSLLAAHSLRAQLADVRWLRLAIRASARRQRQEEVSRRVRAERRESAKREWEEWRERAGARWKASYSRYAREAIGWEGGEVGEGVEGGVGGVGKRIGEGSAKREWEEWQARAGARWQASYGRCMHEAQGEGRQEGEGLGGAGGAGRVGDEVEDQLRWIPAGGGMRGRVC